MSGPILTAPRGGARGNRRSMAYGQVTRMTFERSLTGPSGPPRAGVLTISPTVSPDFGRQPSSGAFLVYSPIFSAEICFSVWPGRSHSYVAACH